MYNLIKNYIYTVIFASASFLFADTYDNTKVEKYLVDYSYLKEFSPEILGIYVIKGDIPLKIMGDTHIMGQILGRYLVTRSKAQNSEYDKLISENLFNKFSHKHYNYHTELRDLDLIIRDNKDNINKLYYKINEFILKKKNFYLRQNNHDGVAFCNDIEKTVVKILLKLIHNDEEKEISSMSKIELISFWLDFKKNNYPTIQKYFETKADKLISLDSNDTFELKVKAKESKKFRYYFISLNMFGQTWYLEIYDDYVSDLHEISLIEL